MMTAIWISVIGILYTYLGYPALMWMLSRIWPRTWTAGDIYPQVSIVLPVHNGGYLLEGTLHRLFRLDYPNIADIIVVSDGSTDGTADLLARARDPRFRPIIIGQHGGKAAALNAGIAKASGEVILFVDLRPKIADGAIRQLVSNFEDPHVGCAAGRLVLRSDGHDAATAAIGGLYWRYEQWIRRCESTFDSPVGVYGGFYAIRRSLVRKYPDGIILDDMYQPLSVIRQGYRSVLDHDATVSDTWPTDIRGEFDRKVRTLAGNYQLFKLAPWLLTPRNRLFVQIVSHKFMRLVVPYLFLLLLLSSGAASFHSPVWAAFALAQTFTWFAALVCVRYDIPFLHRMVAPATAVLTLNAAAVVGLYRFFITREPLWRIWKTGPLRFHDEPPGSTST